MLDREHHGAGPAGGADLGVDVLDMVAAVFGVITSRPAICLLDRPRASRITASTSRAVSPARASRRRGSRCPAASIRRRRLRRPGVRPGPRSASAPPPRRRPGRRCGLGSRIEAYTSAAPSTRAGREIAPPDSPRGTRCRRAVRGAAPRSRRAAPARPTGAASARSGTGTAGSVPTGPRPAARAGPRSSSTRQDARTRAPARPGVASAPAPAAVRAGRWPPRPVRTRNGPQVPFAVAEQPVGALGSRGAYPSLGITQHVQALEEHRVDVEEITRQQAISLSAQECPLAGASPDSGGSGHRGPLSRIQAGNLGPAGQHEPTLPGKS